MNWYLQPLKKYAIFNGRARRKEFWIFTLINLGIFLIAQYIDYELRGSLITIIFILIMLIPSLAVSVRRLHDTGKSGWLILLNLIPIIGPLILLVFYLQDSQPAMNKYGPNPKTI